MPDTRPVDRASPVPLWRQIHDDLRRRLDAGQFSSSFPGELALVEQYGVSRHTVREALRRLRAEGVVLAARGRAPRIAGPAVLEQPLGALYSLFASVEAAGQVQRSVVRALDVRTDPEVASRMGIDAAEPLLHLERLRLAGGEPLAVDRVWLPAQLAGPLLEADFTRTALYDELAARCGTRLSAGQERIRAVLPGRADRVALGIGSGVAAFSIERVGRTMERAVEWRHTLVRGDRFAFSAEFSARQGYHLDVAGDLP